MIYTRRFWRHSSVLATRSFGQGVVVALGGDVFNVWNTLDAKAVLFAGAGMAASSVAMSLGRATVAPRRDTPPDLVEINKAVDRVFADAYVDTPIPSPKQTPPPHAGPDPQAIDAGEFAYHAADDGQGHPDGPAMRQR